MDGESNTWNNRPESTVAQNFAADLDSMFGLSSGVATLSQTVEEKKANVTSGQSELEQLEARLRATEERLKKVSRQNSPSRPAEGGAESAESGETAQKQTSPLSKRPTYPDDRPPTGQRQAPSRDEAQTNVPGRRGQTNGRDDYVMVNR